MSINAHPAQWRKSLCTEGYCCPGRRKGFSAWPNQSPVSPAIQSPRGNAPGAPCRESTQSIFQEKMYHTPFLLSTSQVGLERNSRSWAAILKMRALLEKATSYSEPRSQNLASEIKNKLCLQKMGPKVDFQVLETPHYSHRSIIPIIPE